MEDWMEYGYDIGEGLPPSQVEAVTGHASVMRGHVGWVSETGIATCVECGAEPVSIDGDFYDEGQRILNPCACPKCCGEAEPEIRTFVCACCRKHVSWDEGCADEHPDVCDSCWAQVQEQKRYDEMGLICPKCRGTNLHYCYPAWFDKDDKLVEVDYDAEVLVIHCNDCNTAVGGRWA